VVALEGMGPASHRAFRVIAIHNYGAWIANLALMAITIRFADDGRLTTENAERRTKNVERRT